MKSTFKIISLFFVLILLGCSNEPLPIDQAELDRAPKGDCPTAFAYCKSSAVCFDQDGFNRWGWRLGPISPESNDKCEIYAGAGKCTPGSGTPVGYYEISYVDDKVIVEYFANEGYEFTQAHLYVGTDMYPTLPNGKPTVAPGKYPYKKNILGGTDYVKFELTEEFTEDIFVIAHSVVCSTN